MAAMFSVIGLLLWAGLARGAVVLSMYRPRDWGAGAGTLGGGEGGLCGNSSLRYCDMPRWVFLHVLTYSYHKRHLGLQFR